MEWTSAEKKLTSSNGGEDKSIKSEIITFDTIRYGTGNLTLQVLYMRSVWINKTKAHFATCESALDYFYLFLSWG